MTVPIIIPDAKVIASTQKAICVRAMDLEGDVWVPRAMILPASLLDKDAVVGDVQDLHAQAGRWSVEADL